jgi:hypothetical protein
MATDTHATMEETVVFFAVWAGTTMWKRGPIPGYITIQPVGGSYPVPGGITGPPSLRGYKYGEIECWRGPAGNLLH